MPSYPFKAYQVIEKTVDAFQHNIAKRNTDQLPQNGLLIKVAYSSLNYKDALSALGHKGITRKYPHTPGIDASGEVIESNSLLFKAGDKVIVTGYDLGMNTDGGFGEYINVPAEWVVPLPPALSLKESMVIGTAGFTAALALHHILQMAATLQNGILLVSGATGGVGSMAVNIAAKLGFQVVASSGKQDKHDYLKAIGATEIINRSDLIDLSGKALLRPRWDCAIDTVGGITLATILKTLNPHGSVAVCGNVLSSELQTTVYPFLLNGVNMLGVNSATTPMSLRLKIWNLLSNNWRPDFSKIETKETELIHLHEFILQISKGILSGRVILSHNQ